MSRQNIRLEDLARIAGVSIATISRALNDSPSVNLETKKRIWKIAKDHNYAFRPHMPAMMSRASSTITVALPTPIGRDGSINDPFYLELIGGVGQAAHDNGCNVLITPESPQNYDDLSTFMSAHRGEGIIFLGQGPLHDRFNRLADTDHRFVVWGADLPGQCYCSVGSDNILGGRRATSHLARLGRQHIAFLGDTHAPEVQQRFDGFLAGLAQADIAADPALLREANFELESAEAATTSLMAQKPEIDGIICASDLIAVGAVRALERLKINVPNDVSVIGYDNILVARYHSPAITTISQDLGKAGRLMVSKLLNGSDIGYEQSERLPTELVVRDSCGA
ncbi:MAG: LacI family DNA-binding transcriptional regulator [bacterium]